MGEELLALRLRRRALVRGGLARGASGRGGDWRGARLGARAFVRGARGLVAVLCGPPRLVLTIRRLRG